MPELIWCQFHHTVNKKFRKTCPVASRFRGRIERLLPSPPINLYLWEEEKQENTTSIVF